MDIFRFHEGAAPLLVSVPHCGTYVPPAIEARLTEAARRLPDTDWHVDRLYAFATELGASLLTATHARYVVDLNRDPAGRPLYPGADNTEICPTTTFRREPIYREAPPDAAEIAERVETYWRPYHARLAAELERLRERWPKVVLLDAHSIASELPRFFEGRLPDLNLGTAGGRTADSGLTQSVMEIFQRAGRCYSSVLNGRFTGGYITRRYGDPERGVHALQLEMAQAVYMDETPPFAWRSERAQQIRPVLRRMMEAMRDWATAQ